MRERLVAKGSYRSTLLKKSALVSTAEKYALEIEVFTLNRRFGIRSRVAAREKGIFSGQHVRCLDGPTFFNVIGRFLPVVGESSAGSKQWHPSAVLEFKPIRCKNPV